MDKDKILLVRSAPIEQLGKCIEVLSQTYVNNTIYLLDRKDQLSKSMEVSDKLEEGLVFSTSGRYSIFNKGANQWPVKTFDKAIVMFRDSTGTGHQNLLYYMLRLNAKKLMSISPDGNIIEYSRITLLYKLVVDLMKLSVVTVLFNLFKVSKLFPHLLDSKVDKDFEKLFTKQSEQ